MKIILSSIALWMCCISVSGQAVIPDTIYVYKTVTVYDTIVIHDTIRVKKVINMPILQPRSIDVISFPQSTEKILSSTATFSENNIILHESNKYHKQKNVKTMKLNITNNLSVIILTAQTMSGLSAQETIPAEDMMTFPMQFSIVYPMTTQGDQTVNYRYNLSFNLFTGKVGAVKGVEFSGLLNHAEQSVKGIQFGGLYNRTHELTGVQFGGLGNTAKTVKGIQFSGLANISEDVTGIQYGGIANITESILGVQFGGITNICKEATAARFAGIVNMSEYTKGVQFAGIVNLSEKSEGAQFAGIVNISNVVSGASFSGVYNRTGTLRGYQFGIVNVIDTIESGASLALVNIVKKGFYREWSLTFADYLNVGLSYKMGIQKFYTIFTAGANFMESRLWVSGIGIGNRTVINQRFNFQPEIMYYQYYPQDFKNIPHMSATHLKFGFIWKLHDRIGLIVAPSFYHFQTEVNETMQKISPLPPFFEFEANNLKIETNSQYRHSIGAGISIGIIM